MARKPVLLCVDSHGLSVRRYVPNQYVRVFDSVEEWTVKDPKQFFESLTPGTAETLRREG